MARTPKNQILKNIKAQANEFVYADSGLPFSGYYHIISGRAFAGSDETTYPKPVLLEKPQVNNLTNIINTVGLGTAAYNLARRNPTTLHNLSPKSINPNIVQTNIKNISDFDDSIKSEIDESNTKSGISYYFQKLNDPNHIIKKISYDEASQLITNPINKIVSIDFSADNIDEQLLTAEKIIPGITIFASI
jgi:hypothetical protein